MAESVSYSYKNRPAQNKGSVVDGSKVIIMSKLAVYDKEYGPRDRKDNEFFRHDYIYRKNLWSRLCAVTGAIILLILYWVYRIVVLQEDILKIDYQKAWTDAAVFVLAVMVLYTLIGTALAAAEYARSQERLKAYARLLNILDRKRQSDLDRPGEDSNLYYERNLASKRNNRTTL